MTELEQQTGRGFGDPINPLLISVRSGANLHAPLPGYWPRLPRSPSALDWKGEGQRKGGGGLANLLSTGLGW